MFWHIDYQTTRLVDQHRGTLPMLLACPHGGDAAPEGVPARTGETTPEGCDFEISRDLHTREIAEAVAQRMLDIFGEAPYVVAAGFHRKYLDVNRREECAFETAAALPFYEAYHDSVRSFVDEIRAQNDGLGFLFDLHGTTGLDEDPADVYLGTAGGASIARLLADDSPSETSVVSRPSFPYGRRAAVRDGNADCPRGNQWPDRTEAPCLVNQSTNPATPIPNPVLEPFRRDS